MVKYFLNFFIQSILFGNVCKKKKDLHHVCDSRCYNFRLCTIVQILFVRTAPTVHTVYIDCWCRVVWKNFLEGNLMSNLRLRTADSNLSPEKIAQASNVLVYRSFEYARVLVYIYRS
jgi:hypothetical protein